MYIYIYIHICTYIYMYMCLEEKIHILIHKWPDKLLN